jgi:lipopolysaccharide/colanic/teichoic acid biosynthesis glycosyltransferase
MLAKNVSVDSHATGRFTKPATLDTSSMDIEFAHLTVNASPKPLKVSSLTFPPLVTARPSFYQLGPKGAECDRSTKSRIRQGLFVKRIMDMVLSTIFLVLLWPLMLLIAIAVKLESPGNVIYRSLRVGKSGSRFYCYKFRTMVAGSDVLKENLRRLNQRHGPFFKIADDPRLTRLGRFLRKYSLDELPQFWNVLKGDMSLVGPRPHPVDDVELYSPEHLGRLEVKPGLTGLWQVTARAIPSFDTCMRLDLAYIKKWNLLLDCRILMKTIPAVLAGNGE